ncbi:MAG: GIY-YIG nuclease family protein [Eubacteriales bacterium]|nr:GIY-YIG nuclease family protein [Eubacteriales bacterium]
MYYLYIVCCKDNTLYTGITTNLERRIKMHNDGTGAKYTRGRGPVRLVYSQECADRGDALKRELFVKSLSRQEKEKLCSFHQ